MNNNPESSFDNWLERLKQLSTSRRRALIAAGASGLLATIYALVGKDFLNISQEEQVRLLIESILEYDADKRGADLYGAFLTIYVGQNGMATFPNPQFLDIPQFSLDLQETIAASNGYSDLDLAYKDPDRMPKLDNMALFNKPHYDNNWKYVGQKMWFSNWPEYIEFQTVPNLQEVSDLLRLYKRTNNPEYRLSVVSRHIARVDGIPNHGLSNFYRIDEVVGITNDLDKPALGYGVSVHTLEDLSMVGTWGASASRDQGIIQYDDNFLPPEARLALSAFRQQVPSNHLLIADVLAGYLTRPASSTQV